jgi:hypothetical protein
MARTLRIEYPGAICDVMNRGDRRIAQRLVMGSESMVSHCLRFG